MTYSIKAKLMIAMTSATVLGMSAFMEPVKAAALPQPQPYSLPSGDEEIIQALFTLVYTNDAYTDLKTGLFKMAVKNYTEGIGRNCTTGELCKFKPDYGPVDLDLIAEFFPEENYPFENGKKSDGIFYSFRQDNNKSNKILDFWLRLKENPSFSECSKLDPANCKAVDNAINDVGFILQNNLLGKADRVLYKDYDPDKDPIPKPSLSDGAGKVRILPNSVATVPEPSITLAAFASVGTGLLLKRKTKQQPK